MIDWLQSIPSGDRFLAAIVAVLLVVTVVDALQARRQRATSPEALLEAARTELFAAQCNQIAHCRGDLLLVNVRQPYDTTATPMLIDSSRLSPQVLDAVHRTRAPVLLRRTRKPARGAA